MDPRRRTRTPPRRRWTLPAWALALAIGIAGLPALAQELDPSWTQRVVSATNESTSVALIPPGERRSGWDGWFADAWEGNKRIFRDGRSDLLLPLYSWHPAWAYPNRKEQNSYPWGVGVARTLIDERDNERIVFALGFSDSHYDFQPMAGYAWIARWPMGAGIKGGLGYTVFLTARSDASYLPFPAALPLASIGTERFMLYGTYIPTTDVVFVFARISLDAGERGSAPGSGTGVGPSFGSAVGTDGRSRPNLLYGAGAWVNTDASGVSAVASGNAWAPVAGYRHFLSPSLALDVSVSRANISLNLAGEPLGTFDLVPVTLAAQYHFPAYRGVRLHAGIGVAYNRHTDQDLPGYSLSSGSFSPVMQAGASVAVTDALVVTGGLSANFTRAGLSREETTLGSVELQPIMFSLGLGYAF